MTDGGVMEELDLLLVEQNPVAAVVVPVVMVLILMILHMKVVVELVLQFLHQVCPAPNLKSLVVVAVAVLLVGEQPTTQQQLLLEVLA
tara:strand:- start:249 stop:512 length:264 start_codon:yes stop_codon:yes gene_type:complete